nr:uncharacterized protein LOC128700568 [Cherax quadricarinatus]
MAGAGSARPGRHPPSLRMVVGVVVAVVVVGQVVALPGTFFTNEEIRNKWLPSGSIDVLTGIDQPLCEAQCTVHPKCNAYAISLFERKCVRYNAKVGKAKPVQYLGYNLYILKKTTDDGYNVYGTNYLKLYLDRKNAFDASKACADEGGTLPSVTVSKGSTIICTLSVINFSFDLEK